MISKFKEILIVIDKGVNKIMTEGYNINAPNMDL